MPIGRIGQDFVVNSTTANGQYNPSITALADGRFLVTWESYDASGSDASDSSIRARLYNADGSVAGGDFVVNSTTADGQYNSAATALTDGRFLVTWESYDHSGGDISGACIRARLYNADGSAAGNDFVVNSTTVGGQYVPSVTALPDGRFVVTWDSNDGGGDTSGNSIRARLYTAAGLPAGNDFVVNATTANNQYTPSVTALRDGRFVVTWESNDASGGDTSGYCIRTRLYNADGSAAGNDFVVNSTTVDTQDSSSVTALSDGRFVVTWESDDASGSDTSGACIRARLYNADGSAAGNDFVVNSTTADDQFAPAVTALADGRFVVAWESYDANNAGGSDTSGFCIRARLFNTDGSFAGDDFVVNSATADYQVRPSLAALADGRFVATWQSHDASGSDTSSSAIRAQLFDPTVFNGTAGEDVWRGGSLADRIHGDAGADTLSGLGGGDLIDGGAGNDRIDGGAGGDAAVFSGGLASYTIQDFGTRITVTGPDGTDTLASIEQLTFADATLDVADDGDALFDSLYYFGRNTDVFFAGRDALDHFNVHGWREGRDPNGFFDVSGYLAANKDVAAAGVNPLEHYHQNGWKEGRDPSAWFDTALYLINNPDVAAAGIDPLAHYLSEGMAEGRTAYAAVGSTRNGFDAQYYLFHNPDVAAAGVDPLTHFNQFGWYEGRNPNALFDTSGYLAHYADVAAAGVNPLDHYNQFGWIEGRDPSASFDTLAYLAANPDVAVAGTNPLQHFLQFGIYEGRSPFADGIWG